MLCKKAHMLTGEDEDGDDDDEPGGKVCSFHSCHPHSDYTDAVDFH